MKRSGPTPRGQAGQPCSPQPWTGGAVRQDTGWRLPTRPSPLAVPPFIPGTSPSGCGLKKGQESHPQDCFSICMYHKPARAKELSQEPAYITKGQPLGWDQTPVDNRVPFCLALSLQRPSGTSAVAMTNLGHYTTVPGSSYNSVLHQEPTVFHQEPPSEGKRISAAH